MVIRQKNDTGKRVHHSNIYVPRLRCQQFGCFALVLTLQPRDITFKWTTHYHESIA